MILIERSSSLHIKHRFPPLKIPWRVSTNDTLFIDLLVSSRCPGKDRPITTLAGQIVDIINTFKTKIIDFTKKATEIKLNAHVLEKSYNLYLARAEMLHMRLRPIALKANTFKKR